MIGGIDFGRSENALGGAALEEVLRMAAEVVDEIPEGVVAGVDGPDDFIERENGFASGIGDFPDIGIGFRRQVGTGGRHVAEKGKPGEFRADLVVHVAGDARAFLMKRRLLLEAAHAVAQATERKITHKDDHSGGEQGERQCTEPPGLPIERIYHQVE